MLRKIKDKHFFLFLSLAYIFFNISQQAFDKYTHIQRLSLGLAAFFGIVIILILLSVNRHSESFRFCGERPRKKNKTRGIVFLAALSFFAGIALFLVIHETDRILWSMGYHHFLSERFVKSSTYVYRHRFDWLFILLLIPELFLEEFIFRKCLLSLFLKNSVPFAGVLTAALFAISHSKDDILYFWVVFVLGLVLNQVYLKTGNLLHPTLLHVSYDLVVIYIWPGLKVDLPLSYWIPTYIWCLVALLLLKVILNRFGEKYIKGLKPAPKPGMFPRMAWGGAAFLLLMKILIYSTP